jgi:hypothetical protein
VYAGPALSSWLPLAGTSSVSLHSGVDIVVPLGANRIHLVAHAVVAALRSIGE